MNLMVTIAIDNQWDCPQDNERIYFKDLNTARQTGVELLREYNSTAFCVRRIRDGHYKTLGYFNKDNQYIR